MEKNCKWHFKEEGGRDVGPNDPVDEKFKGLPYYSIVREAIQNSMDAVDNQNHPVIVDFSFMDLNRLSFPNLFDLESHIKLCMKYYSNDDNAKRLFKQMLKYLNGNFNGHKRLKLKCLKISDFNTKGMPYDQSKTNSPFYAFLRSGGVSAKEQGAGGSFGFGKGAYYTMSPVKSILVSTLTKGGKAVFEGSTILTTHKDEDGKKLTAYGYYDNNNGNPVTNFNDIPELFRRDKPGTDIIILGLWEEDKRKELMMKSVLNNFWLAIYDKRLVVKIDNEIIDSESLTFYMDEYFDGQIETGRVNDIEKWNPKSYYNAVKYAGVSDQYRVFEEDLKTLGEVKLYVYLEKRLANRVSYFRKPRMVVYKRTNNKLNDYSAVFICENERGNEILRLMENPAHNEWKKELYPKKEGKIDPIARNAENEISKFVNEKLEGLSKVKTGSRTNFLGLEEYLSIPEDLAEKDEHYDFVGDNLNTTTGKEAKDITDIETGSQTTINNPVKIKPKIKPNVNTKRYGLAEPDDEGEKTIFVGGENGGDGGTEPGEGETSKIKGKTSDDDSKNNKMLINVNFRSFAQKENGILYHILFISPNKKINRAEIELFVGSDNDKSDKIDIVYCSPGTVSNSNFIKDIKLYEGRNKIKIRFADNIPHSIKLRAYEIQ